MLKTGLFKVEFEISGVKMDEEIVCAYRTEEWDGDDRMNRKNTHVQQAESEISKMLRCCRKCISVHQMYKITPYEMV